MSLLKHRLSAPFLSLLIAACAQADQDNIPLIQWVPNDPPAFDFYFNNDVHDPPAVKVFQFVGEAASLVTVPTTFDILIHFDYVDATGSRVLIPPAPFGYHNVLPADGQVHHIEAGPYILDFCPEEVSIHFEITSEVPIQFQGLYDHTCIHIPEPSSVVMLGLAWCGFFLPRRHS
jgi:hypothetical protein